MYALQDLFHACVGLIFFVPLLFVPGYLLNRLSSVLSVEQGNVLDTAGISLTLSMSVFPVFLHLLGRTSIDLTRVFFWMCVGTFVVLIWRERKSLPIAMSDLYARRFSIAVLIWLVVSILFQIDLQWNGRVWPSGLAVDHAYRIGLISAISRSHSIPPANPFLAPGSSTPLGYYYFWFLLCSLVSREAPSLVGARGAMMAGTAWTAIVLWAAASLWLRLVRPGRAWTGLRWAIAAGLFAVSGLDIVAFAPGVLHRILSGSPHWIPYPAMDWWSFDQVTIWADILLWVPHSAAALAACATGLLILLETGRRSWKQIIAPSIIAGACFASAAGMSIYVAFGFLVFFFVYVFYLLMRRWRTEIAAIIIAGATALLLTLPFLLELAKHASSNRFMRFGMRRPGPIIWNLVAQRMFAIKAVAYGPAILLTLGLEFGFYLIALVFWWRTPAAYRSSNHRLVLIFLFLAPLLTTCFFRSDGIVPTNDLGMRGVFAAQFALLVIAAEWLLTKFEVSQGFRLAWGASTSVRTIVMVTAAIGVITTATEILLVRTYSLFEQEDKVEYEFIEAKDIGQTVAASRDAYRWLDDHSSRAAVVQANPAVDFNFLIGLYGNRQTVVAGRVESEYNLMYASQSRQAIRELRPVFNDSGISLQQVQQACLRWGIQYLVVSRDDSVWDEHQSWIWKTPAVYANPAVRVYQCSGTMTTSVQRLSAQAAEILQGER